MRRPQIQLVAHIIDAVGIKISKESNPSEVWKFILGFTLHVFIDILASMSAITNTDNLYRFIAPIPHITGSFIVQSGIYFIYYYRNRISVLIYEIDANLYTYPDEHLLQMTYPWYLREENIPVVSKLTKYASLNTLFVLCVPILAEILYYGRIKTFIYPIWTPFQMDNLTRQLLVFGFEFVQGFCGLWFNYVSMVFFFVVVTEFVRQYKRLTAAVVSLERRTLQNLNEMGSFDQELRVNILHCIRHHQILHKNFRTFQVYFSRFFSVELVVSMITFTFTLYTALNASDLGQITNYFQAIFFIWTSFLIRCLVSEIFPYLDATLAESILWDTPWYRANKQNGKLLVMFHSAVICNPLRLYGLSIFEATRATFGRLIRMTYSFYNVLKRKNQ